MRVIEILLRSDVYLKCLSLSGAVCSGVQCGDVLWSGRTGVTEWDLDVPEGERAGR